MNIAVMVFGFILFWPVGLAILFWIMSGRQVRDLPAAIQEQWEKFAGSRFSGRNHEREYVSDNAIFNEYQQTQYDRIQEIKDEIQDRARRFREFRADTQRRIDEEEFNRFMATNPSREG